MGSNAFGWGYFGEYYAGTTATTNTDTGSGTVTLSGSATEALRFTDTSTGTVTLAGTRVEANSRADTGTGTVTVTGTSLETESGASTVIGLGGNRLFTPPKPRPAPRPRPPRPEPKSVPEISFNDGSTGLIRLTGTATESLTRIHEAAGTVGFSGASDEILTVRWDDDADVLVRYHLAARRKRRWLVTVK